MSSFIHEWVKMDISKQKHTVLHSVSVVVEENTFVTSVKTKTQSSVWTVH